MTLFILIPILIAVALGSIIVRQVFAGPRVRDLDHTIPYLESIPIGRLKNILGEEFDQHVVANLSKKERRRVDRKRLEEILMMFGSVEHNVTLYLELGRYEVGLLRNPKRFGQAGEFAEALFRKALTCKMLIFCAKLQVRFWIVASGLSWIRPLPRLSRVLGFSRMIVEDYRNITAMVLELSARHGDFYHENMIAAL